MSIFYVYVFYDGTAPIYVGYGCNTRWRDHFKKKTNVHLNRWLKLNPTAVPEIVMTGLELQAAKQLEQHLIARFGRLDRGTGSLFNHTDGGDGASGLKLSTEAKTKISKGATRRWSDPVERQRQSEIMRAVSNSPEARSKRERARPANWMSAHQRKIKERHEKKNQKIMDVLQLFCDGKLKDAMFRANIKTESGLARFIKRHSVLLNVIS
jgi:hypothetical protein